jgi:Ricin-type beta-trefoil lectin domain-like
MPNIAMPKLRRGAPFGAALVALALATSAAMAAPALAAEGNAPAAHTVGQTVKPSIGSESVARGCYNGGEITMDNGTVMDAQGYGNPANIDDYGSNGGTNQQWALCELSDGYDEIVSDYNGNMMCLNVEDASYTSGEHLLAWPCNTVVSGNEQWRRPENTPDTNYSGFDYLVPAGNYSLCANVSGGLGTGHLLILYACNSQDNEAFGVAGSTTVKDRLGAATYAASYIGYQASDECNMFSGYWQDGTPCSGGYYSAEWCADFDAYVWRFGENVTFTYRYAPGYINGNSGSFYSYGESKGTWHPLGDGYTPKPGDVAVYGLNTSTQTAAHSALVIGITPGDKGPNVINGNDSSDAVGYSTDQTQSAPGDDLNGYASPPGL